MIRNWKGLDHNENTGQGIIHEIGWQPVMVKRYTDNNPNVGINGEYDPEVITFDIRARIDLLEQGDKRDTYIGLVEPHILLMMSKGDHWLTQAPNDKIEEYRISKITDDEIILEKM